MNKSVKVKGIRLLDLVKSQGFLIPVQYTADRMEGGLEVGKIYNLEITEVSE